MALVLSTDHLNASEAADGWRGIIDTTLGRSELLHEADAPPRCAIVAKRVGELYMLGSRSSPFRASRVESHIRADGRDNLTVAIVRGGSSMVEQDGRRLRRGPGEIVIADLTRPFAGHHDTEHEIFGFSFPRERLERVFGSSRRFTLLPIGEEFGSLPIIGYLTSLFDGLEAIEPQAAAEMANVGLELVVNALGRRLAHERALPQSAALLVHRAHGFVRARLADPELSPATIAAALGISVRHLQALLHRRRTTPSEMIWRMRLACARDRLASPGFATVSVADLAYGCGFADQGHFSRRFKAEYGLSPRDWRQRCLIRGG